MSNNSISEKVPVKAVFLSTPDDDEEIPSEVFAYFPEEIYDTRGRFHLSYAHNGQHSGCMEMFALECTPAPMEAYKPLLDELNDVVGYEVTVIDAAAWLKSNGKKLKAYRQKVQEITAERKKPREGETEAA